MVFLVQNWGAAWLARIAAWVQVGTDVGSRQRTGSDHERGAKERQNLDGTDGNHVDREWIE